MTIAPGYPTVCQACSLSPAACTERVRHICVSTQDILDRLDALLDVEGIEGTGSVDWERQPSC